MADASTGLAAVVTDIEGTTTPLSFVRDVLFPYARNRLSDYLRQHGGEPEIAACLREVEHLAPGKLPLRALQDWMAADAKITPLKTLQGLIWADGYAAGALKGILYPDVAPTLHAWHAAGLRLYVYSSGSEVAQRLIFKHSTDGDLGELFSGFFDTRVGGKREASSYAVLATKIKAPTGRILFLSDVAEELDAAAEAGLRTCQVVRPEDGTVLSMRHPAVTEFSHVIAG